MKQLNVKPLKELCENFKQDIVDGPFGSNLKRDDYESEGIPVLKIQNIKPFKIKLKKMDYVNESKYIELKRHSYKNGDIIMTKLGDPLGASAIVNEIEDGLIVADLVRIRAKKIDTKYLCYHLNSPNTNDFINSLQKGTTRPRVRIENVRDLPIFAPPLAEQQRIVAILDEAFAAIGRAKENAEKNLQNARELFDSYLQSVFANPSDGWEVKQLLDICDLIVDCEHKTAPTQKEGFPSIRTPNIGKGELILQNVNRVSDATYKEWTRRAEPQAGDLILAREAPAGNVAVIPENLKVCLGQRTVLIRPNKSKINPYFLAQLLLSKRMQERLLAHSRGATVAHVNMKDIRGLNLDKISSLSEQQIIVDKLKGISVETQKLENIYRQKINDLDELKKSILQKAFNGELS